MANGAEVRVCYMCRYFEVHREFGPNKSDGCGSQCSRTSFNFFVSCEIRNLPTCRCEICQPAVAKFATAG